MASHDPEGQRRKSHGENYWKTAPPHIVRCAGHNPGSGKRCRFEALPGSMVCAAHGGMAPQVRRRAAERAAVFADEMLARMVEFAQDSAIPPGVRLNAMKEVLDRGGLAAAQVHKIVPNAEDPVEQLLASILNDPEGLVEPPSEPLALPAGVVVQGEVIDERQEAQDRIAESWTPDAEVHNLSDYGTVGPYAHRPMPTTAPPEHIREGIDRLDDLA